MFAGVSMGIGEINFIDIPGAEVTHDVMEITADFTKDLDNPIISSHLVFGGYAALNFQPLKDFVSAEEYKNIRKNIATNYTGMDEYLKLTTTNDGTDFIGKKPFILDIDFEGRDLMKKAGDNYLFSVGQTIGSQMQLYQEDKRVLPVELDYPHSYDRKIRIILPKGATVENLDKFKMDLKTQINGKTEAAFTSNYEQKGDEIIVSSTEFYNLVDYPVSSFNDYRNVINGAADFNKIVIIIKK